MIINGISIEPGMITRIINLIFGGWVILAILAQVYRKLDLIEDVFIVTLILLIGLRFTLLGMLEGNLVKAFLIVPLASGAFRIIRFKLGRWGITS
jgi:hypothetical protein